MSSRKAFRMKALNKVRLLSDFNWLGLEGSNLSRTAYDARVSLTGTPVLIPSLIHFLPLSHRIIVGRPRSGCNTLVRQQNARSFELRSATSLAGSGAASTGAAKPTTSSANL
jgi:hypothetical protein